MPRPLPRFDYPYGRNRAFCTRCRHVVESRRASERVFCSCGAIMVAGGHEGWVAVFQADAFLRLGDYDSIARNEAHDPYRYLVVRHGTLSGYTAEEYYALPRQGDRLAEGELVYVMDFIEGRFT